MNIAGVRYLKGCGYKIADNLVLFKPEEITKLDLDHLYEGNRVGASIYVNPTDVQISHGPNGLRPVKMKTTHGIPRARFLETFEKMRQTCGLPAELQLFGANHTIPPATTIAGICIKDDQEGFGHLTAESMFGPRPGDFNPEISISEKIAGGRRIPHTREYFAAETVREQYACLLQHKDWAFEQMLRVMRTIEKDFGPGLTGLEFILETERMECIFVDHYRYTAPLRQIVL